MHARENALQEWIENVIKCDDYALTPLAGDASFRRYYRLQYQGLSQVIMDAPPGKEDLEPFIHVAQTLTNYNVLAPQILAEDKQQGFLLLSDFGNQLLLDQLNNKTADDFYQDAIKTLLKIQDCPIDDPLLPYFDKTFMLKEMNLCVEWFLNAYLNLSLETQEQNLIEKTMDWIANQVASQPLVFIHRDYHSRNIMLVDNATDISLGVIDFQDAMRGPLTYDLVSLLKDCYVSWPRAKVIEWATYFYANQPLARSHYELPDFIRAFDLCGLQRHLKVLGVFSRLYLRDNKSGYLKDLPLTLKYTLECTESYEELHPFFHFLKNRVELP
ncbi:MAG: phosphotransferase [Legionella sp.]|nr:MAG: phosphotransferase [Legionella sp.]